MGSVVMGGGLMDLLIRPVKCPGRPCLIGGGILIQGPKAPRPQSPKPEPQGTGEALIPETLSRKVLKHRLKKKSQSPSTLNQ